MTNIALTIKYFYHKDVYPILLEKIKKFIYSLLKTINFDDINKENKNIHNPNSLQTFYHKFIKFIKSYHSDIYCTKNEVSLRIASVNVTKSAVSYGFGHIY